MSIRRIIMVFAILFTASAALTAQKIDYAETEEAATKVLLKKDLRQAIAEAEKAPAADLRSLLWRLTLYNRAAYSKKIALTVRQIAAHPDYRKNAYQAKAFLATALQNAYFFDSKTLWLVSRSMMAGILLFGEIARNSGLNCSSWPISTVCTL